MRHVPIVAIPCRRLDGETVGVLGNYVDATTLAGAAVVLIPMQPEEFALASLATADGILFAGGEDIGPADSPSAAAPERDRLERALARAALDARMPILGICRGMQLLNEVLGGSTEAIEVVGNGRMQGHQTDWRGGRIYGHAVLVSPNSLLEQLCGQREVMVNGTHTQCVAILAPGMRATAHCDDGIVEAIERSDAPLQLGVQWHPEILVKHGDPFARGIFARFVGSCQEHRMARGAGPKAS